MTFRFVVGETYSDFIRVIKRTEKTIVAYRTDVDNGYKDDAIGEHRYKVQLDADGNEYTVIDRFNSARGEKWGKVVSADPSQKWYSMRL